MWSYKNNLAVIIILLFTGCGYRPLYELKDEKGTFLKFSEIKIAPIKDRTGQLLHNELILLLHPQGASGQATYHLNTKLSESETSLGVKKSAIATRGNLQITAIYNLIPLRSGPKIRDSKKSITVSYNLFSSPFATQAAKENARIRAVKELAQEIRHHLGVFLKNKTYSHK